MAMVVKSSFRRTPRFSGFRATSPHTSRKRTTGGSAAAAEAGKAHAAAATDLSGKQEELAKKAAVTASKDQLATAAKSEYDAAQKAEPK